jgi:dTDP-4-dehydrorhamnose reductase
MTKKNILVTGAAGLLGSNILFCLRDKYRISGIDRNDIKINNTKSYFLSLFEKKELKKIIIKNQIQFIIHCAALTNVDECEKDPNYAYKVNVETTKYLSEISEEFNIKLIFISSDAVFDGEKKDSYKETDTRRPKSVYGNTKMIAEDFVTLNPNHLVIRTNLFGFNYRDKVSFSEWILYSLQKEDVIKMVDDVYFSPLLVNELVKLIDIAIELDLRGIYHFSSNDKISKYDFAFYLKDMFDLGGVINKIELNDLSFLAPRTHNMSLDNSKLKNAINNYEIKDTKSYIRMFRDLYLNHYKTNLRSGK